MLLVVACSLSLRVSVVLLRYPHLSLFIIYMLCICLIINKLQRFEETLSDIRGILFFFLFLRLRLFTLIFTFLPFLVFLPFLYQTLECPEQFVGHAGGIPGSVERFQP